MSTNRQSVFPGLHESLRAVLSDRLGWNGLREVQEQAYEAVCGGNDVLVIAPTAGGKTESALIPVIDALLKSGTPGIACIYISPLKALINDQEERIASFCRPAGLTLAKWHGDVPKGSRGWTGDDAPQILMITPESLEVILHEPGASRALRQLRFVIVDELHAFVESERGVHLRTLLDRLDKMSKTPAQRIGLSATIGNPDEVLAWFSGGRAGRKLVFIPSPPAEKKFRFVIEQDPDRRIDALTRLVAGKKALVFVNSRSAAETILQEASGRIRNLCIHHSSVSPAKRKQAEEAFHGNEGACIVCTSTLELGIDIGDLDIVVQVGPPDSVSSFLQRMGRSGRRDKAAYVAWLLSDPEELLTSCAVIECAREKNTESLHPPEKPWNVLVQHVFLSILFASRAGRGTVIRNLLSLRAFSTFSRAELGELLDHLVATEYLTEDGEMLMIGPAGERAFGRSNYRELYSVIPGGGEYRAITPDGEVVGTLDARFAHREEPQDFSLGGETWSVVKCDEGHNLVVVVPGGKITGTSRVFRSAGGESAFSSVICRAIRRIVSRGGTDLPLNKEDAETLRGALAVFPAGIRENGFFIQERKGPEGREVTVWTFSGRRLNQVLAFLLKGVLGKGQVRHDDLCVRVVRAGKSVTAEKVEAALQQIPRLARDEIARYLPVPAIDAWKFAGVLPDPAFCDMILRDYYRVPDVIRAASAESLVILPPVDPENVSPPS